jgi:hypothetical protein
MAINTITADVYCVKGEGNPVYRMYVDGDLLTERNWIWPTYEIFIRERMEVDLAPGEHQVELVDCSTDKVFRVKNITINGEPNAGTTFTVNDVI